MKSFIFGSAILMFASSFAGGETNQHVIPVAPGVAVQKVSAMQAFGQTLPPIGYVTFCREHHQDCLPQGPFADRVELTQERVSQLIEINDAVNTGVKPMTDLQLYGVAERWTYPTKAGDCEDYVLLKRKMLIDRGWPESTLLITVVRDENDEGHAILTVRTDHGDFILDNKQKKILPWRDTPYTYVKQQSETNPLVWISLVPPDQGRPTQFSASQSTKSQ